MYGGGGDDTIRGGTGDTLDGGSGTDTLSLDLSTGSSGVSLDFAALLSGSTVTVAGGTLVGFEHVERVVGTAYSDTIDASADSGQHRAARRRRQTTC
jgi:Ca2+-binding RTX toxin-like protein